MGLLTKDEIPNWYAKLSKPSWTPPNKVFPIAWTWFYGAMGIASFVVQRSGGKKGGAMTLYALQLALNFAWTPLFFKAHVLDAALIDIAALLGVATAATVSMAKASKKPEVIWPLMGPYLGWLAFATALNFEILRENNTETWLDWKKVSEDVDKKTEKARAAAAEAASKAATAAKETAAKAAEVAKEAGAKAAEAAQEAGAKVAAGASAVADEIKSKAANDMAELKQALG